MQPSNRDPTVLDAPSRSEPATRRRRRGRDRGDGGEAGAHHGEDWRRRCCREVEAELDAGDPGASDVPAKLRVARADVTLSATARTEARCRRPPGGFLSKERGWVRSNITTGEENGIERGSRGCRCQAPALVLLGWIRRRRCWLAQLRESLGSGLGIHLRERENRCGV
jgi:hypothetical protein